MTIISARSAGPISQAAARMPATATTDPAAPSSSTKPRGMPPGDRGGRAVPLVDGDSAMAGRSSSGNAGSGEAVIRAASHRVVNW